MTDFLLLQIKDGRWKVGDVSRTETTKREYVFLLFELNAFGNRPLGLSQHVIYTIVSVSRKLLR